jgi:outer membrane lipopolysaccharide assembly protein LptE/RlpB
VGAGGSKLATDDWRLATAICCLLLSTVSCGYHEVGGRSAQMPPDVHTIAVPAFQNRATAYHIEQVLTEAVVREFLARTQYRVVTHNDADADAALHGTITAAIISPITYDSQTGRASTAQITLVARVSLVDRHGKVLYENQNYVFREEYQLSLDPSTFFQEETPAERRLANDFASTLVSNVLEAY